MREIAATIPDSWKDEAAIILADSESINLQTGIDGNSVTVRYCTWYYVNKRNPPILAALSIQDIAAYEDIPEIHATAFYPDGSIKNLVPGNRFPVTGYSNLEYLFLNNQSLLSIPSYEEKMLIRLEVDRRYFKAPFSSSGYFRDRFNCLRKTILLSWPASIRLNYRLVNNEGLDIGKSSIPGQNCVVFEAGNLRKIPSEYPVQYPEQWFAGVHFSFPPTGVADPTWRSLGDYCLAMLSPALVSSPDIKACAASIVDTRREKIIEESYRYVQKHIRYLADENGNHGIIPRPAPEVLEKGYGDCKEMAVVLKEILDAKGIPADLVLISSKNRYQSIESTPALSGFNHMIVYIPQFNGSPIFLDPTVKWGSVTNSYYSLINQKAFILERGASRLDSVAARKNEGIYRIASHSKLFRVPENEIWQLSGVISLKDRAAYDLYPILKDLKGEEKVPAINQYLKKMFNLDPVTVKVLQEGVDSIYIGFSCRINNKFIKADKSGFLIDVPNLYGYATTFNTSEHEGPMKFESVEQSDSWEVPDSFSEMDAAPLDHEIAAGS